MNEAIENQELIVDQLAADVAQQVVVEGDAALPGSMRDAATVLCVLSQVICERAQAQTDQISVSGQVNFHVLYTQGDLTRVQVIETGSDFSDMLATAGVTADMNAMAEADVLEAEANASGGRLHLRAVVEVHARAVKTRQVEAVSEVGIDAQRLRTRTEEIALCHARSVGKERTLLREEFDLSAALGVGETLFATAQAHTGEITGGESRANVAGVIDLCVYHTGTQGNRPLVVTRHSMPFEVQVALNGMDNLENAALDARVALRDVLADSMEAGEGACVLRVEIELETQLLARAQETLTLLSDAYTLYGDALNLEREQIAANCIGEDVCSRESGKLILALPEGSAPVGTVLAAFALPIVGTREETDGRTRVDGVLDATVIYLPMDSGIPVSVKLSQAFTATFDVAIADDAWARLSCVEVAASGITSDRLEVRYVLELCGESGGAQEISVVTGVEQTPCEEERGGICVYFPSDGETMWDVARRYRVDEAALSAANGQRETGEPVIVLRRRHV